MSQAYKILDLIKLCVTQMLRLSLGCYNQKLLFLLEVLVQGQVVLVLWEDKKLCNFRRIAVFFFFVSALNLPVDQRSALQQIEQAAVN